MSRMIVTTGPESSGKTTLATQLAETLNAPLVAEVSREYLNEHRALNPNFRYGPVDLLNIAKQQRQRENRLCVINSGDIVCDTDLLVIKIWSEVRYGSTDPWIESQFKDAVQLGHSRHYLLCDWHIPWQADPLRENPHDREQLFAQYQGVLDQYKLNYTIVTGNEPERLRQALTALSP